MNKKISLLRCDSYEYESVKKCLLESIQNLGGLSSYINKGDKVLLKANLLMKKKPEEATTTHPTFIKALAEILIRYGADVVIGDSPGGPFKEPLMNGIYRATGMEDIAKSTGAELNNNFNSFEKENPQGLILKKYLATDMLNDVDKVISVSKLKTHGMMTLTGAVKNMFGTIPGIVKAEYHLNMKRHDDFADALIDICIGAAPALSFMDAIVGMEGEGPSAGNPRKLGAVIASDSPYHIDKTAASIINLKFSSVPTIKRSIERGICSDGLDDITFIGEALPNFIVTDFKIPQSKLVNPTNADNAFAGLVNKFIAKHVQPRPIFKDDICIGCGICVENCPAKIIRMDNGKPQAEISECIRCFCCQELCPKKAVKIYRPSILRLWH